MYIYILYIQSIYTILYTMINDLGDHDLDHCNERDLLTVKH